MNKSLIERGQCLRLQASLSKGFWIEAVNMMWYLLNRSPRASFDEKVTKEVWKGNSVGFNNFIIFECPTFVHISSNEISKLDPKSKRCVFVSYSKGVKEFKF